MSTIIKFTGRTAIYFLVFAAVYVIGKYIFCAYQINFDWASWFFGWTMGYFLYPLKTWLDRR